jgi:hypothetical protein
MPRGKTSKPGTRTINKNGYGYIKTEDRGWVGEHILVMEEHLGRRLEPGEYVQFKSDDHTPPITLDMIELRKRGDFRSRKARIAQIEARIAELQAEKERLEEGLDG